MEEERCESQSQGCGQNHLRDVGDALDGGVGGGGRPAGRVRHASFRMETTEPPQWRARAHRQELLAAGPAQSREGACGVRREDTAQPRGLQGRQGTLGRRGSPAPADVSAIGQVAAALLQRLCRTSCAEQLSGTFLKACPLGQRFQNF